MKYLNLFTAVLLVVIFSCSHDKDQEIPINNSGLTSYFPVKTNNFWTYKTENTSVNPIAVGRDSLYIGNDSVINTVKYKRMKTKILPTGFFCSALRNNGLRVDGKLIKLSGDVLVNIGTSLPVAFSVSDFVLFKENATSLEEFGTVSGTITNNTAIPGYPLTVKYVLSANEDGSLATLTSNGVNYEMLRK